jgi:hypothetical protein
MKVVKFAAAFAAMTFLAGISSQAFALDAFWHGVRSTNWGDGVSAGLSNWYDQAPQAGAPVGVPNGTATFAAGAMQFNVIVNDIRSIGKIHHTANAPRYMIVVDSSGRLVVAGAGLVQDSVAQQSFYVSGTMRFMNSARVVSSGRPPEFQVLDEGSLQFRNTSRGGDATAQLLDEGELTFFEDSSADQMNIVLRNYSSAYFYGRSNGGAATFRTQSDGELRFDLTQGPGASNRLTARQITNGAFVRLGSNTLTLQTSFTQTPTGALSMSATRARVGKLVANRVALAGGLDVTGATNLARGQYVLIQSGGRTGTFANVFFHNFPAGMSKRIKYVGNNVVLVLQ